MHSYLITDPKYYTQHLDLFSKKLLATYNNYNVDYSCFRDKTASNFEELAKEFLIISKQENIKNIFINSNINLAIKLKFDGVHLTSNQYDDIKLAKTNNLKVIISTHNEYEIERAIKENVDAITYSPIFTTPNKGKAKGIDELKYIVSKYNIPIFALGGIISKDHISKLSEIDIYGFASIRYFLNQE